MSPITHLLGSWWLASKLTGNARDRRLATVAGVAPDLDGVGLVIDVAAAGLWHHPTHFYAQYHHVLLHGLAAGVALACLLAALSRHRLRLGWVAFGIFHLHLLCDFVGSRGPSAVDLWPIYYLAPLSLDPVWVWKGQWRLDGWQNRLLSVILLAWALWQPTRSGYSIVGCFSAKADAAVVAVLTRWRARLEPRARALWTVLLRPPWRAVLCSFGPLLVLLVGSSVTGIDTVGCPVATPGGSMMFPKPSSPRRAADVTAFDSPGSPGREATVKGGGASDRGVGWEQASFCLSYRGYIYAQPQR